MNLLEQTASMAVQIHSFAAKKEKNADHFSETRRPNRHLDLPERDEQALLQLGVQPQQLGRLLEVPAGRGQCVHTVRRNSPPDRHLKNGSRNPTVSKNPRNPTTRDRKIKQPNQTRRKEPLDNLLLYYRVGAVPKC